MHGSGSSSGSGSVYRCIVVSLYRFLVVAHAGMLMKMISWQQQQGSGELSWQQQEASGELAICELPMVKHISYWDELLWLD